jgi:hypothetical protein
MRGGLMKYTYIPTGIEEELVVSGCDQKG